MAARPSRTFLLWLLIVVGSIVPASRAWGQADSSPGSSSVSFSDLEETKQEIADQVKDPVKNERADLLDPDSWTSPEKLSSTLKIMFLLTALSVAPAILLMTTCFVRVLVVLGLLRQALGAQQLPPSQVITSLSLFITLLIMTPVWKEVYENSVRPYTSQEIEWNEAWERGKRPIVQFMGRQIENAKNTDDIWLFYQYYQEGAGVSADAVELPDTYEELPLQVLLPAYVISELKTAFLIGFSIYLPFLVLDIVIASVTISMGMLMLPPVLISLPFKLMLFVLVDGWRLVVSMLMQSFGFYWN